MGEFSPMRVVPRKHGFRLLAETELFLLLKITCLNTELEEISKAERYDHDQVELKWQKIWEDAHCFEAKDDYSMPKFYPLIEFPYPSGHGLHVGHPRSNTALDIIARKRRMEGYNVLYPIGWDAFGLPTENYAIKTGIHPAKVTHDNIEHFRAQLKRLGSSQS